MDIVNLIKAWNAVGKQLVKSVLPSIGMTRVLMPSGGDDTAAMQAYVNEMAAAGLEAVLGPGSFILSDTQNWRASKTISKWGTKGIGLRVRGSGAGNTRIYYSGDSSAPMVKVNSPTSANIGNRNYFTEISDMSILRATSGTTEIAAATTSGQALVMAPLSATGEVLHTSKLRNLFIDGFDYPITLSDSTLMDMDTVWLNEFLTAIRVGYNVDLVKVRHSMFGSEQFGSSYRNSAIAYQNNYNDGYNTNGAYDDCVEFEQCWFMKIGKAVEMASAMGIQGLKFSKCYFEDCRQYIHALGTTGQVNLELRGNKFSKQTTNDVTQTDPLVANYMAKIQFDGTPGSTDGVVPYVTIEDNVADFVQGANAWISFNNRLGRIFWKNNYMRASSSFGHVRCIRTGYATWRTLPNTGIGEWVLGDTDQAGIGVLAGEPIQVTATISSGTTYNISTLTGNHFVLTLPDGDCTIQMLAYSGTPPSHVTSMQTKVKITLIVPASVGGTRTITWGSSLKMNAGTLTYTASEQNKRATILLEGYANSGGAMQLVSIAPNFA